MKLIRIPVLAAVIFLFLLSLAYGEEAAEDFSADFLKLENEYFAIHDAAEELLKNTDREISDRDTLLLQRRFVDGRDFYFLAGDFRGAAEIFYAIVTHPAVRNLPNLDEAHYYLAESLYQTGYFKDSRTYFRLLRSLGQKTEYFSIAMVRLIQLAVLRDDFAAAENYYSQLLNGMPADYDGSLGRYIYGRALYQKGQTSKGRSILEGISQEADYYPMAQYFLAVVDVKARDYQKAVNRLRRIKSRLDFRNPEYEAIKTQADLSLGRLHYEMDDYPRAINSYVSVSPESSHYDEAMYESLWVLLTRNDYMVLKIQDERIVYDRMNREFGNFTDTMQLLPDAEAAQGMLNEVEGVQGSLTDMRRMFLKIDDYLENLQAEAVTHYDNLVKKSPNSPLVPEAELLIGNINTQAADFKKAKEVFQRSQRKYSDFYNRIYNAFQTSQGDEALVGLVGKGFASEEEYKNRDIPAYLPPGVPEEIAYWMAADREVRKVFDVYEQALAKRRDLDEMRQLIDTIETELRALEKEAFPILKETRRRSLELIDKADDLQARITSAMDNQSVTPEQAESLSSFKAALGQDESRLRSLQATLEKKKNETLALYRRTYRELSAPVPSFNPDVENVYSDATDAMGMVARKELSDIQDRLGNFIQKAKAGIVEAEYRQAESAAKDIRNIQKEMTEELRRFRLQYQKEKIGKKPSKKPEPDQGEEE